MQWQYTASSNQFWMVRQRKQTMSHATVSHLTTTEWTDEMEAIAREKFIPLIMSVGAKRVRMIRTGDLSFCVVTDYPDAQAAETAQSKIAEIRSKAANELPMTMVDAHGGSIFAQG
jgi:hypothetical protein